MRFVLRAVALASLLACGSDGVRTTEPVVPTGPVVTSIAISSPAVGPLQVGATLALVAEVRDQAGKVMTGKPVLWETSDAAVASVSTLGVVTGVGPGLATISASVEGKTGSITITVASAAVFAVAIAPLAASPIAGQSTSLVALVSDRNGTALIGRRVTWSSSAPMVATVDGTGRLNALTPGTTTVTALSEGVSGSLAIVVVPPEGAVSPSIIAITPATLSPGSVATITGANFLSAATTTVTVAGATAAVVAATTTELTVAVPVTGLPCQSAQPVPVTVATVGGMATLNHPLVVAKTRPLAVGESFVTDAAGSISCNELPAGGSYLVSVFNSSPTVTNTVRFELRGTSGGGAITARAPLPGAPMAAIAPTVGTSVPRVPSTAEREHVGSLENDLALLKRLGAPSRGVRGPTYSRTAQPPVPLTPGATTTLKFHYSNCTATGITNVTARVVYVGTRSVVLEDVAGPLAGMIDSELIAMAQEFETISYPLLLNFGDPLAYDGNTDANGRIVMLFTPRVNALGTNLLGFVSACDLYPVSQDPAVAGSNEAEIFYARTVTDTTPGTTALSGRSQWRRQMPATMIHEAKHITSYAERLSRSATQFEQVWLEEATAQLASEMFGRAIRGNTWRGDAGYTPTLWCESRPTTAGCADGVIAVSNHFSFLTNYLQNFETKSILSGAEDSDIYGSAWLFARWLVDTYGGASEGTFLRSMVQTGTRAGTANVEAASGKLFPQLFAEFTLMLAADNLPNIGAPYVEPSWNLPDVFAGYTELGSRPPAPLALRQSGGGTLSVSGRNLKGGGAVMLRIGQGAPGETQLLDLRSTLTTPLISTSTVGLAVLRIE